jgi:hypothetical protein
VDVALRDGSTVRVRRTRPEDRDAVRAFLEGLSEESRWLRFFGAGVNLADAATVAVCGPHAVSIVAVTGAEGRVVGHGICVRQSHEAAEVAFIAGPHGTLIVDARVRIEATPARRPIGALDR